MIDITRLCCGVGTSGDALRYEREAGERKPIVVWNMTRRCNLACIHCYADSANRDYPNELTGDEAQRMIRDLGEFGAPVILFSGGEPLMRDDIYE
ncbi:MAG: radical SAM protein, partial [Armatimonadetes bacterium]|nr:radical SAM protein [Armatimonadota bacterium]